MHHRVIEPETAGKIIGFITAAFQDTACDIAAQAALADHIDSPALLNLIQTFPQFIHRNILKSFNMSRFILLCRPGIQQRDTAVTRQGRHFFQMPLLQSSPENIVDHKPCHIHRILGGRIWRCIGKIQILQLVCPQPGMNGGRQHIDPLIDTFISYDLRTQQTTAPFLKDDFHRHQLAAGIIPCVAHGRQNDRIYLQPRFSRTGLIDTRSGCRQVKDLDHAAALRAMITTVPAADIVRNDTPLFIGRTCQREQRRLTGHIMPDLHSIPRGIDIRN